MRDGSCASIWRYIPTPESSEGAGEDSFAIPEPELFAVLVATAVLVWDTFRDRFGVAVPLVLSFQAGRSRVTVAFTIEE